MNAAQSGKQACLHLLRPDAALLHKLRHTLFAQMFFEAPSLAVGQVVQVAGQNQLFQGTNLLRLSCCLSGPFLLLPQLLLISLMHHLDPGGGIRQVLHDVAGILPLGAEVYQLIPQGLVTIQLVMVVQHEAVNDMMLCVPHDRLAERQGDSSVKHFDPLANGGHFLVWKEPVTLDDAGFLYIVKDIAPPGIQLFVQNLAIAAGAAITIGTLRRIISGVPFSCRPVIAAVLLANAAIMFILKYFVRTRKTL